MTVLRRALLIAPLLIVLTLIMGQVDEVRVYYPLVPILFWLSADTLMRIESRPGSTHDHCHGTVPRWKG